MARALVLWLVTLLCVAPGVARADDQASGADGIALLPLDADRKLELYGQPVASEIARALVAGGVSVVVVSAKMTVPATARLILDGTIKSGPKGTIVLTIRLRKPTDGFVVATMEATAPTLAAIDQAAAELSSRVLPAVRDQLAARPPVAPARPPDAPPRDSLPPMPPPPATRVVYIGVTPSPHAGHALVEPLATAAAAFATRHGRPSERVEPMLVTKPHIVSTVAASESGVGLAFEVLGFEATTSAVPLARARVRVRIADRTGILFERIVVTDTVVGDKGQTPESLAARVAREVVDIVRPHVARRVVQWTR